MTQSIADILDKAADLIEPEGAWTDEYYAVSLRGNWREPNDDEACRFCMIGAIAKVAQARVIEAERGEVGDFLRGFFGRSFPHHWNDEHTQAEVVAKLREAAAKAKEQGL